MQIYIRPPRSIVADDDLPGIYLVQDRWNDWWQWETLFFLFVKVQSDKPASDIGHVKIGLEGQERGRPELAGTYLASLPSNCFSVGQDSSYYEQLSDLDSNGTVRNSVLASMRDVAFDLELFTRVRSESVMSNSLLRNVPPTTVKGQFHRLSQGGARLTDYEFSYTPRARKHQDKALVQALEFKVDPESLPPTNLHVLIGRNGTGKTTLLNEMSRSLLAPDEVPPWGHFEGIGGDSSLFANLVSVTFSAFDPFKALPDKRNRSEKIRYSYIGLKKRSGSKSDRAIPKTLDQLSSDFAQSAALCAVGQRARRWRQALETLSSDPMFGRLDVTQLIDDDDPTDIRRRAIDLFSELSSGHKIVLLTITRLVETVDERTLVLLDEPEAHLHPPLLSAFTRALSDLLTDRNGVAIIATHSPVILQEVPASCVYILDRLGQTVSAERPETETFGENVGRLTRDVFKLEVTASGFHALLRREVDSGRTYERIEERAFRHQLGHEALAVLESLVAERDDDLPLNL